MTPEVTVHLGSFTCNDGCIAGGDAHIAPKRKTATRRVAVLLLTFVLDYPLTRPDSRYSSRKAVPI